VKRRLGHRLRLVRAEVPDRLRPGEVLPMTMDFANDGFAAPYNPRLVEIVLRHALSGAVYDVTLPDDPRAWRPTSSSVHRVEPRLVLPRDVPEGDYDVLLAFPDPEAAVYPDPRFAIRLANPLMWEPATGYNDLVFQISVASNAPPSAETGADLLVLAPTDGAPTPVAYAEPPALMSDSPVSVGTTSVNVRVHLLRDSGLNTHLSVFWGTADGGTNPAAWSHSVDLGPQGTGLVVRAVEGLLPATTYAYRFRAVSAAGTTWGDGGAFTTTLDPEADTDGDGLPDGWEMEHFGSPTNGVPFLDSDIDQHSNVQEYVALTDPRDPASHFRVAGISGGATSQINYLSSSGRFYALEGIVDGTSGQTGWEVVDAGQWGTGATQAFTRTAADAHQAYRIRVSILPD
jgi:hypothetical protein